jgi:NAD(P)-dependent dehydrogenase (short-subunit alcohol dehydrogenase family)
MFKTLLEKHVKNGGIDMRLKDKVAIVTGASSGIGKGIAEMFVNEGAKVVFSDLNEEQGKKLVEKHGEKALFVKCDVSKSEQVDQLIKATVEKFGRLDIMVNNAGIYENGNSTDATDDNWHRTIEINLSGAFYGIRAASKYMKDHNIQGSIINISSIAGSIGIRDAVAYCASKGGMTQMTRAVAIDLADYKIRVNNIAPGAIISAMTQDRLEDPGFKEWINSTTPLKYVGAPEDIAYGAVYLASDESRYVTGDTLYIDGGWTAH